MSKPYPDLDEETRARVINRRFESQQVLTAEETLRIIEHLKAVQKLVPFDKLAELFKIPSWRQHQIYSALKRRSDVKLHYKKGEWFAEFHEAAPALLTTPFNTVKAEASPNE